MCINCIKPTCQRLTHMPVLVACTNRACSKFTSISLSLSLSSAVSKVVPHGGEVRNRQADTFSLSEACKSAPASSSCLSVHDNIMCIYIYICLCVCANHYMPMYAYMHYIHNASYFVRIHPLCIYIYIMPDFLHVEYMHVCMTLYHSPIGGEQRKPLYAIQQ